MHGTVSGLLSLSTYTNTKTIIVLYVRLCVRPGPSVNVHEHRDNHRTICMELCQVCSLSTYTNTKTIIVLYVRLCVRPGPSVNVYEHEKITELYAWNCVRSALSINIHNHKDNHSAIGTVMSQTGSLCQRSKTQGQWQSYMYDLVSDLHGPFNIMHQHRSIDTHRVIRLVMCQIWFLCYRSWTQRQSQNYMYGHVSDLVPLLSFTNKETLTELYGYVKSGSSVNLHKNKDNLGATCTVVRQTLCLCYRVDNHRTIWMVTCQTITELNEWSRVRQSRNYGRTIWMVTCQTIAELYEWSRVRQSQNFMNGHVSGNPRPIRMVTCQAITELNEWSRVRQLQNSMNGHVSGFVPLSTCTNTEV